MKKTDLARELIQIELIYKAKQLLKEHKKQQSQKNKILKENYQNYLLSELNLLESTGSGGTATLTTATTNNVTIDIKNKNVAELITECEPKNINNDDINKFIKNLEKIQKTNWGDSRVALKGILEILSGKGDKLHNQLTISDIKEINQNVNNHLFIQKGTNQELVTYLNGQMSQNEIYRNLYFLQPNDSGPWGTPGKGEILVCLVLENAESGGSKSNDIIRHNGNFIEIKTYQKGGGNNVAIPSKAFINKNSTNDINLSTIIPTMQEYFTSISNILKRFRVSMQLKLKDEGDKLCNYSLSKTLDNSYNFDAEKGKRIYQKMYNSGLFDGNLSKADDAKLTKIKYFLLEPNSITVKQSTIQTNSTLCIKSLCLLFVENEKINDYITPYNALDTNLFNIDKLGLEQYLKNNYQDESKRKELKADQMKLVAEAIKNQGNGDPENDFGDIAPVLNFICYFSKYYKWTKLDIKGDNFRKSLISNGDKIGNKDFKAQLKVDEFCTNSSRAAAEKYNLVNAVDIKTGFSSRSVGKDGEDPVSNVFGKYNYPKNEGKVFPLLVKNNNGIYEIAEEDVSLYQSVKSFYNHMPDDAFKGNNKGLLKSFLNKMNDYDQEQNNIQDNKNIFRFNPDNDQKLINIFQPFIDIYNEFYFEDNDPLSEDFRYNLNMGSFGYKDFDELNTLIDYSIDKTTVLSKDTEITIETKQNTYYLYTDLNNISIKNTNGSDANISDITDNESKSFKSLSIVNSDPDKDAIESGKDAKKQYNSNKHNKYFGVNENRIKNHLNKLKILKETTTQVKANQEYFINSSNDIKELEYIPILENLIKALLYLENAIINYYDGKFLVFEEVSATNITCFLLDKETIKTQILESLIGMTITFKGFDPVINPLYLKASPQIYERSSYIKVFFERYVDFKSMLVFYKITKKDKNGNTTSYNYKKMSDGEFITILPTSTLDEIKAKIKNDATDYFKNYVDSLPKQ